MKKLLLPLFLLALLFIVPKSIYASDLEVMCGASICQLSSKDPIFQPSEFWAPGKSLAREVLIKNTDTQSKEVFIKIDEGESAGELDEYINIDLRKTNETSIWQGNLGEFISEDKILIHQLPANSEFNLEIEAEMDENIPNDKQGGTSVFNFSFGFAGENRGEQNSNNNSQSSGSGGSGSESSESSSETSASSNSPSLLTNAINNFFGVFEESEASEGTIAGEQVRADAKDTLGAGINECRENYLWIVFLVVQLLIGLLLFIPRFRNRIKLILSGHTIAFVVTSLAIYFLSCFLWPIIISLTIFIIPAGWLMLKNYKENRN